MSYHRMPAKFLHPDDVRQNRAAQRQRASERSWTDKVCEPNRIYDALVNEAGYNHNYHAPQAQAIVYDSVKGKWVEANTVTQLSNTTKPHVARENYKRVMKSYVSNTDW